MPRLIHAIKLTLITIEAVQSRTRKYHRSIGTKLVAYVIGETGGLLFPFHSY